MDGLALRSSLLSGLAAALLVACGPGRQENASQIYKQAMDAYSQKRWGTAKMLLDSIAVNYNDVPAVHADAQKLRKLVVRSENERSEIFLDSLLKACEANQKDLLAHMEIDDPTSSVPVYVDKNQKVARAYGRCYLRATTDSYGRFEVTSCFTAPRGIGHDHVRVSAEGVFVESQPVLSASRAYSFSDGESTWEFVKYTGADAADIAQLVADNVAGRVVVDYLTESASATYVMTELDKQAVARVWHLAALLRETQQVKLQIRNVRQQLSKEMK